MSIPILSLLCVVLLAIIVISLALEIQSLTANDLSAALELDQACFGGLWNLEAYQRELESPNTELVGLFSSVSSSRMLGMGCFWSIVDEAHITIVAVHPYYQHQGLGAALLYSLLLRAYDRGLERATLEVRVSNTAAISLYQKFGFKTAGRRRGYYRDNGEDALILWTGEMQQPDFTKTLDTWRTIICDRLSESSWQLIFK